MHRALDDGCLRVVAPAGYGKTLAVQQAVEQRDGTAAWHACRDRDADGGRLLVSVLEAVRRTVPGAADVLLDGWAGAGRPPTAALALVDDLERLLVEPTPPGCNVGSCVGRGAQKCAVSGTLGPWRSSNWSSPSPTGWARWASR
jgi:hypothetical protein